MEKKYIWDNDKIRTRIKKRRKELGYNSAESLEKELNKRFGEYNPLHKTDPEQHEYDGFISYNRINKIESAKSSEILRLKEIFALSEVLDVSIEYLLGVSNTTKHEIPDSGLSEKASEIIHEYTTKNDELGEGFLILTKKIRALHLLSWLIENGLLDTLSDIAQTNNDWWKQYDFSPKINEHDLMMKYIKKASDEEGGYLFFPTEPYDKEEAYWNALGNTKTFKANLYDSKEKVSEMINEYCNQKRDDEDIKKAEKNWEEWFKGITNIESEG